MNKPDDKLAALRERLRVAARMNTPRFQRAKQFAEATIDVMLPFIPSHPRVKQFMFDHLLEMSYEANAAMIIVPAECDHMTRQALEARLVSNKTSTANGAEH